VAVQRAGKRVIVVERPVEVRDGDKLARIEPSDSLSIDFTVDFDHPLITNQSFRFVLSDRAFEREVARARTFCLLRDVEKMQSMGLAQGGSLDNAVVVDDFSILNPEGLRFSDEFARHKVLDALGDLSLAGLPVIGAFRAFKSGHAMNQALVRQLLADATCHRVVRISAERTGALRRLPRWQRRGRARPGGRLPGPEAPPRLGGQRVAVARVGDGDERRRPLAQVLAVEVGDAVLGHHEVHVRPGGDHARPLLEVGDDARLAVGGGGGEGDDGLAALGERGGADEVHLAAHARVELVADRVGAHLPGEVHLHGAVDGGDLGVAPDDLDVVHVGHVEHGHLRVVVEEVVEAPGARRRRSRSCRGGCASSRR
jgi:hypothetical protein